MNSFSAQTYKNKLERGPADTQQEPAGQDPIVSIVIPAYRRPMLLERTIESVMQQTFVDFELIVVDDDPSATSRTVVTECSDPRVRYILRSKNGGPSAAQNTGIAASRGRYIAFLDEDDIWLPTKLEKQVAMLENSPVSVGMVYCGLAITDGKGRTVLTHHPEHRGRLSLEQTFSWITQTSTMVVRRDMLQAVGGFDEALLTYDDSEINIRLAQACSLDYVDEILVQMGPQTCRPPLALLQGGEHLLQKHRQLIEQLPARKGRDVSTYHRYFAPGRAYCHHGDFRTGRRFLFQSVVHQPATLRNWTYFIASLGGKWFWKLGTRTRREYKAHVQTAHSHVPKQTRS